jgi:DNA-binding response OmpR family regulator
VRADVARPLARLDLILASAEREPARLRRDRGAMAKILIIEDDPDVSGLLGVRLKRSGYAAAFASDAVTALTIARKEEPDLVLLDLGLPGGGGHVVMERLKTIASLAHVPVIVVSAQEPSISEERALATGARAYFQKPLDMDGLLAAIRRELGEAEDDRSTL